MEVKVDIDVDEVVVVMKDKRLIYELRVKIELKVNGNLEKINVDKVVEDIVVYDNMVIVDEVVIVCSKFEMMDVNSDGKFIKVEVLWSGVICDFDNIDVNDDELIMCMEFKCY